MGKGDRRRDGDTEAYERGYERIFKTEKEAIKAFRYLYELEDRLSARTKDKTKPNRQHSR